MWPPARRHRWGPISASTEPIAVVLETLAAPIDPALAGWLGAPAHRKLIEALRARTRAWALRVTGGAEPLELPALAPPYAGLAGHAGPVLFVAPDVPGLSDALVEAARSDLAAGMALSIGPGGDGTPFFVAVARPDPALLALVGMPFPAVSLEAGRQGLELGMLRSERRLVSPADARALLIDPLAPPDLVDVLAARR